MLASIWNQWCNYLFHEGEIGLLYNDLTISVIFICRKISACHFLVILRSESTTEILIFESYSIHRDLSIKIMIFLRCSVQMQYIWPLLVRKIKSLTPPVSYSLFPHCLETAVKWPGCDLTRFAFWLASVGWCSYPEISSFCSHSAFGQIFVHLPF